MVDEGEEVKRTMGRGGGQNFRFGSPPPYMNSSCDWLIKTMKDSKTIEIEILKNES